MKRYGSILLILVCLCMRTSAQERNSDSTSFGEAVKSFLGIGEPRLGLVSQYNASLRRADQQTSSHYYLNNLRLFLTGAYDEKFSYLVQGSFNGGFTLYDIKLSYRFDEHWRLDAGQFKSPFGREYLRHVARLLFVDRSAVACRIGPFRQQGIQLSSLLADKRILIVGGAFNGTGMNRTDEKISLYCGKVQIRTHDPAGVTGGLYAEVDGSVAYSAHDTADLATMALYDRSDRTYGTSVRVTYGDWSLEGEYDVGTSGHRKVEEGLYADVAWRLLPSWEIAGRFDWFEYQLPGWPLDPALRVQRQYVGGLNWYCAKPLKLQLNYIRDETFKSNSGIIQLQYAINYE